MYEARVMPLTRKKKIGLGCFGVFLLVLGTLVVSARRFVFPHHLDVVSIKTEHAYQDPALLDRAFALPVGSAYEKAVITYQPNGSVCGPTSLADVLRSYGDSSASPDKVLAGSGKCPFDFCFGGLSIDELADLARQRTDKKVTVLRDLTLETFRRELDHVNDPARRYIINIDRGPLFGTTGGHHSPLGAYLKDEDLVLVIDVNAKYRPWLVSSERLFQAMDTIDPSTEKKRGLLRVE